MTGQAPVSKSEFEKAKTWFDENQAIFPEEIGNSFVRILAVYSSCTQGEKRAKQTLQTLRQAMGIISKSERGRQDAATAPEALPALEDLDPETLEKRSEEHTSELQSRGHLVC